MGTSDLEPNESVSEVSAAVGELSDKLIRISKDVHAHPELNYEELYASALTDADFLQAVCADFEARGAN